MHRIIVIGEIRKMVKMYAGYMSCYIYQATLFTIPTSVEYTNDRQDAQLTIFVLFDPVVNLERLELGIFSPGARNGAGNVRHAVLRVDEVSALGRDHLYVHQHGSQQQRKWGYSRRRTERRRVKSAGSKRSIHNDTHVSDRNDLGCQLLILSNGGKASILTETDRVARA